MVKNIFKKCIALIICATVLICQIPLTVFAENEGEINLTLNAYANPILNTVQSRAVMSDEALVESINTQLKAYATNVDISDFKLVNTESNREKIIDILSGELPECFHFEKNFGISILNNYITAIVPKYVYTKAEYESMLAECDAVANKMLKDIEGNNKLTDVQKLLLLHDRIALHCEYDYDRAEAGQIPLISHTMYGVFVNKIAVCQGYALAYSYLLDRIGIENYYCGSEYLCHAWNIVYVNNKPYHVDITWDDQSWVITGKVLHDNFLVSTQELINNGHYVVDNYGRILYDYDDSPVDTTYDNYFWQDSQTAFTLLDGEIYYVDNHNHHIERYSDNEIVYDFEDVYWPYDEENVYVDGFARLDDDGKDLLFSLNDGIYKLNLKTGDVSLLFEPVLSGFFAIYGFTYDGGMLICDIAESPSFNENTKRRYKYKVPYLTYTQGDIDNSGIIDLYDVNVIARVLSGWSENYNSPTLDTNGDGAENLKDLVHLARYVAGWSEIVLN